ncbi:Preprotein translocase subunit SecG (TC 3.A.5.1.1) [Aequoribacter fuscus]|jgi:preprotein translocase subunit SecG|uniref:Protein-export membrane protein SecG n=1 Tax=Aequoribacter fuscus TaxID=2518989 RepID=F3KZ02_9GAMM|nr:preprotein translocase subunit SecG [Aequoribacter fuscus]EGG30719.1 Preprotein translocase subunit SecG (TC 3.A.5.1.1) [Aequoribacter fuscus]QHJ87311.1 preprotein translocase subunit SecG [Aequoribacter fuscus]
MEQIILVVHLLVALAIIGLIMIQQGKGADMGASFGAGASQTLLGSAGSGNALTKATSWLVAAFFATSFALAVVANEKTAPVEDLGIEIPVEVEAPASDLPVVDDEPEAMSPTSDLPIVPDSGDN